MYYVIVGNPNKIKSHGWPGPYQYFNGERIKDIRSGRFRGGEWKELINATLFTETEAKEYLELANRVDPYWVNYCGMKISMIHPLNLSFM